MFYFTYLLAFFLGRLLISYLDYTSSAHLLISYLRLLLAHSLTCPLCIAWLTVNLRPTQRLTQ